MVYKILSKVLVNHIKPVLTTVDEDAQSAFISNQLITDNIIIGPAVFHWLCLKKQPSGNEAYAIKIIHAVARGAWCGIQMGRNAPHLFFTGLERKCFYFITSTQRL